MSGTVEQLSIIRAALDPSGYTSGAQAIQRANDALAQSAQKAAAGSETTTRAVESAERAFGKLVTRVDPVAKELLNFQKAQEQVSRAVTLGVATHDQAAKVIALHAGRVDAAVQAQQRMTGATTQTTNALGVTGRQMQQLAPQINDVVTSLLGGASAFQVLTQQGGQITQAMGGVGNTFRTLAGIFTPTRLAVIGVTAAVAASVLAFEGAESRIGRLQATLRATRGDWETFARELDQRMRAVAPSILSLTTTETQQVGAVFASMLPTDFSSRIEEFTRVTAAWARMTGQEALPAARELAGSYNNLEEFVRRLAERDMRGFNEAFREHIAQLVASGRSAEAYAEVMERVSRVAGDVRDTIRGTEAAHLNLSRAWDNVRIGATRFLEQAGAPLIRFFGDAEQGATRFQTILESMARSAWALINPFQQFRNIVEPILGRSVNLPGTMPVLPPGTAPAPGATPGALPTVGGANPVNLSAVALANIPERHRPPDTGAPLDPAALRDRLAWALGISPDQASGVVSGLYMESDRLRPGAVRPGGADYGLAQWVGSRRDALFSYADQAGMPAYDPETQINFLIREIQQNPRILSRVAAANDPLQAGQAFHDFLSGGALRFENLRDWHAGAALRIARMPSGAGSSAWADAGGGAAPAAGAATGANVPAGGAGTAAQRESERLAREAAGGNTALDDLSRARIAGFEAERARIVSGAEGRDMTREEETRVRSLTEAIERETAAINGRENSTERSLRTGANNIRVLQTEDDLRREIARRLNDEREAARQQGRTLAPGAEREIERQVRQEAAAQREDSVRTNERLISSEQRLAEAYRLGARSGVEMEARNRALEEARRTEVVGTEAWRATVERLTDQYVRLGRARAEGQLASQLPQQERQIELIRAENDAVGRNVEERQQQLAVIRERIRLESIAPGLADTATGQRSIAGALDLSTEQLRQQRLNAAEGYGRETGSILGKHIADAIKTGSLRGFREVPTLLWDVMARGLITKPLEEMFANMFRNMFNTGGTFGGGGSLSGGGIFGTVAGWLGLGGGGGGGVQLGVGSSSNWGEIAASIAHSGGQIGQTGAWRAVDPGIFREAPRYHTGRGPGAWTAPNEIAAILTRDEVVMTRRQQERAAAAIRGGMGRAVTVVQNISTPDAASFHRSQAQQARRARQAFARAGRSV